MTGALFITEAGLLLWLAFHLQFFTRPCLTFFALAMMACTASYRVPRPDAEYHASGVVQALVMALAIAECFWLVRDRPRLPVAVVGVGSGALVLLCLKGLDYRFGEFTTDYVAWIAAWSGIAAGGAFAAWDGPLLWLAVWGGARAACGLSYWFIKDVGADRYDVWPVWLDVNLRLQIVMTVLTIAWIPLSARSTAKGKWLRT